MYKLGGGGGGGGGLTPSHVTRKEKKNPMSHNTTVEDRRYNYHLHRNKKYIVDAEL